MNKYSNELMLKYLNDELDKDTREELEGDYNFVTLMIGRFGSNINSISSLVDNYLENERDDVKRTEVLIRVSRLFNNFDNKYNKELIDIYSSIKSNIEFTLNQDYMDINLKEELQAGFYFIFEDYGTNNLVLEYFASMFIEDYFREIDLQEKLKEKDKNESITMFLLNLLSQYDSVLSSYVSSNIKLLDDIKNSISNVKKKQRKVIRFNIQRQEQTIS